MNQPARRTDTRRTTRPATRAPAAAYRPAPYTGDGMECVRNIDPATPRQRLLDVAAWHAKFPWPRNKAIASYLRGLAG